jgi:succinoglycan biosynthesis transport protein ExoP
MKPFSDQAWNDPRLPEGNSPAPVKALPPGQGGWAPGPGPAPAPAPLASQHKLILAGFLLLGLMAGTAYVMVKTPQYHAATTVELVGFNPTFLGMSQVDPQAGTDSNTASASNIQTLTRILTSRNLLTRVMERMNLEMAPVTTAPTTFFGQLHAKFFNGLPGQGDPMVQSRKAIESAARSVFARGVVSTRLIEIQCQSTMPQVAADFINTLTQEHISQTLASRANATQKTSQWMESQLEESKSRLQQAGEKLRDFVQKSGMDFFPEQTTLADSKLRQLQGDVGGIQADRIAKQSRWELAKNTPLDMLPNVLNDKTLLDLKIRLADLRAQLAPLTVTLTPQNIRVQRIQSQIDETQQTLLREEAAVPKRLQTEYEEALRREKLLMGAYNSQTHSVSGQADKASQYSMLKRDVEIEQQLYNSLLQQSSQAALMALAPTSSIRVVDPAIPTQIPSTPNPERDIPEGTLLGGALGLGLLWLRESLRRKKFALLFDTPGHTKTLLGVPELGVIPSTQVEAPKRLWSPARVLHRRSHVEPLGIADETANPTASALACWRSDKSSLLAESFRQTLVSILGTKPKDHSPVYVISSAGPGEGKTTLCTNLAAAMADIGHRVLLIDADLRRANLHNLFELEDRAGLSDILASTAPIEDVKWDDYIRTSENKSLHVMTHGLAEVDTPALLFFSPRTEKLISLLQKQFDCIFIDTAPSLPFPDARLLAKHADGVVLVVRAGITSREGAAACCQRFQDDGIPVIGSILNDWVPSERAKDGYYFYGYGSYGKKK